MKQPYLPVLNKRLLPLACRHCGRLTKPDVDWVFSVVCRRCWSMTHEDIVQNLLEIELELGAV